MQNKIQIIYKTDNFKFAKAQLKISFLTPIKKHPPTEILFVSLRSIQKPEDIVQDHLRGSTAQGLKSEKV